MRFGRVLLVSPPSSSYLGAARPPQNLGYLAQALLENDILYDVLDMRLGYNLKHLFKKIDAFKPELIGVSVVSLGYKKTYDMVSEIKNEYPELKIVVGGPHITVLQERVLEECPAIDYGVVYEGEVTLVEFCKNVKYEGDIKGLIRREDNEIIYNGHREFPKNLDEISFPTYKNFELNKYIKEMPFNSSRGCPLKCIFCPNKMITKKFRWRSASSVVDEIEYWYQKGYRVFNYDDDNFTFFNDRVYEICDEIERRGIKDADLRCSNGIRADRVDRVLLKRMREVGFNYIAFGVDGGNNRMLKLNKKGETIEQIESAIKNSCELGFDVKIFVILGMPHETREDIEDSLRISQKYPIKRVILNNPIPYPGTELFDIVKENNWFIKQPEEYLNFITENEDIPVFETPELSREDRLKILKRCRVIEKNVTRKAVKRMYKKYSFGASLAGYIFSTNFVQWMFFNNMTFRRFVEYLRYRRMITGRNLPAKS
jgi:anaerobic magnesium-protoporphyrin IX monomethyl ester cyclase